MQSAVVSLLTFVVVALCVPEDAAAELRVGAAVIDITPKKLPAIVNGSLLRRIVDKVKTPLSARAIVLDDDGVRLGIVVVDSCLTPRPLMDEAKKLAAQRTKIRTDRMLISATHCHSAPSIMDSMVIADPNYVPYLREKLVEAFVEAEANLEPARVGWAVTNAAKYTAVRRWIRRPDRIENDIFGNPTVRATMHAASNWDNVTGPSGPEDPDLSLISFQAHGGRPIAVLANFSMHYFSGEEDLSADYYGLFCEGLKARLSRNLDNGSPPFVGVMSHGCSGDIWRCDYARPEASRYMPKIEDYSNEMVNLAMDAYRTIAHEKSADLVMAEKRFQLKYRVPDKQRLQWAREIFEAMGDREPKDTVEAYAREQLVLHEQQSTEVVVQAIRIGDIAIATTPTETYALTGLKLKLQSPLVKTMVFDLANGADGYIPPPEQHFLGGYNTWPMRGAGLEVQAEPIIAEVALGLLERVSAQPRRPFRQSCGSASQALIRAKPVAYWRLDEFEGSLAFDLSGRDRHACYEPGVVFFLEGPRSEVFCTGDEQNRAAHFAGGRLRARIAGLGDRYSVALWLWNGMPTNAREISGWMISRGRNHGHGPVGDHLGVGGTSHPGKIVFLRGEDGRGGKQVAGSTEIKRWTWNHVVFVRDGEAVRVHLNGKRRPDIETRSPAGFPVPFDEVFVGGRSDNQSNWEGRLDEVAVFDRALSVDEIEKLTPALE
jgi:hypothetical protein